jgi:acyl-CoA thioesterase
LFEHDRFGKTGAHFSGSCSKTLLKRKTGFNEQIAGETAVSVKAALSPDDRARACADAMWRDDDASKGLGMKIVEVKAGQATLTMTVEPYMVNGQRIAHGGFIFTLADSAFAFACNSHNERVVAVQGNITFIRPGRLGDLLVATAREISRSGRSGIYDVQVTVGEAVIAEFRGHSRSVGGAWLPEAETDVRQK